MKFVLGSSSRYHGQHFSTPYPNFTTFDSAEAAVNERLSQTPEVYLLALTQFATSADAEVVSRSLICEQVNQIDHCQDALVFFSFVAAVAL